MPQPPLTHHLVVLHQGGPKRVERRGDTKAVTSDIADSALTFIPAGSSFHWRTTGPVNFAHLYFSPAQFAQCVRETFDRESSSVTMNDSVGVQDLVVESLLSAMLQEIGAEPTSGLYLDALLETVLVRVIRSHSNISTITAAAPQAMAPYRLRRVQDFVEGNLAQDIDLKSLAEKAGLSRFHFCRVFQRATGQTPHEYVLQRRIDRAKRLMCETCSSLEEIAMQIGFSSASQLSTAFKRSVGLSPSAWRRQR